MPPIRTARSRVVIPAVFLAIGALIAAPIAVQAAKDSPVAANTASAATDSTASTLPSVGRVETCVLDTYSSCTVLHGFGVKPTAITATGAGPSILSIDPDQTTDKSFRLRALSRGGDKYRVRYEDPLHRALRLRRGAGAAHHAGPDGHVDADQAADQQPDDHLHPDQAADVDPDHHVDADDHPDRDSDPDVDQ